MCGSFKGKPKREAFIDTVDICTQSGGVGVHFACRQLFSQTAMR